MEFFLSRYRNLTVLIVAIVAQLLLIAYQVKSNKDVPLLRVWAVSAVTPTEQVLEVVRRYTWGFVEDYFVLLGVRSENEKLKNENGQLKLQNHYLQAELGTADRAKALSVFQSQSQSKTVAARVIGNGTEGKTVFVDRGSIAGVENGMAVVTPDGIVGKVVGAYPTASMVMLITDGNFAAGVISQKNRVRGTLKGLGHGECQVDYVENEEKVDVGEWFFTSGEDRIFPKGFPVGQVAVVRTGKTFKEIYVTPSGLQGGPEEVLIVLEGVHQQIPEGEYSASGYKVLSPPAEADSEAPQGTGVPTALATDADRLREQYKQAGDAQHHVFGEGLPGSTPPDFTKIQGIRANVALPNTPPGGPPKPSGTQPAAPGAAAGTNSATAKPTTPGTTDPNAAAVPGAKPPVKTPAAKSQTDAATAESPSKAKPRTQILVTDPTDADPGAEATTPPAPKQDKPATKQPPPRPPNQ